MGLLERFQADTAFDSIGQFTLDDSKAREKMARYQLVTDEEFLALVFQAMVALGCQSIELEVRDLSEARKVKERTFTVVVMGRRVAVDPTAILSLEEFLFDSSPEGLPYHLLAVAGNAIESACVTQPSVSCVDGDLRYEVVLSEPLKNLRNLVLDRLCYLPCPLIYDGELTPRINLPDRSTIELISAVHSQVSFVRYGVLVERVQRDSQIRYRAVVEENDLNLDASFSHVIEDEIFQKVVIRLDKRANRLLAEKAEKHESAGPDEAFLRSQIFLKHPDPAGKALQNCPLFPLADRKEYISLSSLEQQRQSTGKLLISRRRFNLQLDTPVVEVSDPQVIQLLTTAFSSQAFENAEEAFKLRVLAERNKERWRANPRPVELSPGDYFCRRRVNGEKWSAEIGFLASPGGPSAVDILYQDHLLCTETLNDVPPSASVVVNFKEADVNATWTNLDGRIYRSASKEIKTALIRLFGQQDLSDPESLYPELIKYLLERIKQSKSNIPEALLSAPLFKTVSGGKPQSLDALSSLEVVLLGDEVPLSKNIPEKLLPPPILKFTTKVYDALCKHFGRNRVRDVRAVQQHLKALDVKLSSPKRPILSIEDDYLKVPLELEGVTGELAICREEGSSLQIQLMRYGVVMEELFIEATKVFHARAILDAPSLELYDYWTEFARDKAFKQLVESLTAVATEMERGLLEGSEVKSSQALKLLVAYSYPRYLYWDRPLFPTVDARTVCSLADLEKILAKDDHLLRGSGTLESIAGRTVLELPSPEVEAFLHSQLGEFRWASSSYVIEKQQLENWFQAQKVHELIKVPDRALLRRAFEGANGEIALRSKPESSESGRVDHYVDGRLVCRRFNHLPIHCVAAVESDLVKLSWNFKDVTYEADFVTLLRENCTKLMLEAAGQDSRVLKQIARDYFAVEPLPAEDRKTFEQTVFFDLQGGERISLAALREETGLKQFVTPNFSSELITKKPVLRMDDDELKFAQKILARRLNNVEAELIEAEEHRQALSKLPKAIPDGLFTREFKDSNLEAILGVTHPAWAVGLNSEGTPVGWLRWRGLPVAAVVRGARSSKKRSDELKAYVPQKQVAKLWEWAEELTLAWVEQLSGQSISGRDREHALLVLDATKRDIASRRSDPATKIASTLWELPLFERVDRTMVAGFALASVVSESKEPLVLTKSTWARGLPDSAILVQEGSCDYSILKSTLGADSVQWFESPPLLDSKQLKASLKNVVSWGLAPIAATGNKITKALKDIEDFRKKFEHDRVESRSTFVDELRADIVNLLGKKHYQESDDLFKDLEIGRWPLGPPLYRFRGRGPYRLNSLNGGVRWLMSGVGDARTRRAARTLLVIHWVGLVNEESEQLTDEHEDEFLFKLAERMTQIFAVKD